jgi:hypothetical protein
MLLLLLLLLVGVCNLYRGAFQRTAHTTGAPGAASASAGAPVAAGDGVPAGSPATSSEGGASQQGADEPSFDGRQEHNTTPTRDSKTQGSAAGIVRDGKTQGNAAGILGNGPGTEGGTSDTVTAAATRREDTAATTGATPQTGATASTAFTRAPSTIAPAPQPKKIETPKAAKPSPKAAKPLPTPEGPYKGFTAGIGFNKFFPVGEQVNANFNAEGTNGTITDYLPVPMLRYFFSRKLYVQLEAQFNTPQYTSKNLLAAQSFDTTSAGFGTAQSVFIRKLFYFNLPAGIYYSPVRHLYVGAGLEFAKLTNGVATTQVNQAYSANIFNDSILSTKLVTFKGDSIYQRLKTTEWRLTGDLNYQWEGFTLGVRYNWSLNKFINVRVTNTQVTQSRNSSLQLYLRYTIWRQRSLRTMKK